MRVVHLICSFRKENQILSLHAYQCLHDSFGGAQDFIVLPRFMPIPGGFISFISLSSVNLQTMPLPDSKYFAGVFLQLQKYKMLEPAKLAVTSAGKLQDLIRMAAEDDTLPEENAVEILDWLREEWCKAKVVHGLLSPVKLEEWALDRYSFAQNRQKMAREGLFAVAQSEHSERKRAKIEPLFSGLGMAIKGRVGDLSRTSRDESEREK